MAWWELLAISREARQIRQVQSTTAPVSCPNDGTILLRDRTNRLHCPFDGWVWDGIRNPLVDVTSENLRPAQTGGMTL